MSLNCLKQIHADTHTDTHIDIHTHTHKHAYIHTSILQNNLLSLALSILYSITPLDGLSLNGETSLLVLRLLTDWESIM